METGDPLARLRLSGRLMAQMAILAMRLIDRIVVVPRSGHYRRQDNQRNQGQRHPQYTNDPVYRCVSRIPTHNHAIVHQM